MAKASAAASAMVGSEGATPHVSDNNMVNDRWGKRHEYDEEDFVRRALQCRNGIGLAGGGLRHEVVGEVL